MSLLLLAATLLGATPSAPPRFQPRDGDVIALVGDCWLEREAKVGYLETAIRSRFPNLRLTFRNLAWNGDTPAGVARTYFDPPETGVKALTEHLAAAKPTVLVLGYGMADSLEGSAGLPAFKAGLERWIKKTPSVRQTVVVGPLWHEDLGAPWPDPTAHNDVLRGFSAAAHEVAKANNAPFVDLFERSKRETAAHGPFTDNGIHPTDAGYWRLALDLEGLFDWPAERLRLRLDAADSNADDRRVRVRWRNVQSGRIDVDAVTERLPTAPAPQGAGLTHPRESTLLVQAHGLAPGRYSLAIDGEAVASGDADEWGDGVIIRSGALHRQAEELRAKIRRKDFLYFHRYRPQNITYLLGFRQYEQGQNAKEIAALDGLVAEIERSIDTLQKPKPHRYVLTKEPTR